MKFGKQKQCEFFSRILVISAIKDETSGLKRKNSGSGTEKKTKKKTESKKRRHSGKIEVSSNIVKSCVMYMSN